MATNLITCDKVLGALINKLKTATPAEIDQVKKALGIEADAFEDTNTVVTALVFDKEKGKVTLSQSDGKPDLSFDFCGWQPKPPCEYYATLNITTEKDECNEVFSRVVYGFHPMDIRDPAADIALLGCNDEVVGFIYSTSEGLHTEPVYTDNKEGGKELRGYALRHNVVRKPRDENCECTG